MSRPVSIYLTENVAGTVEIRVARVVGDIRESHHTISSKSLHKIADAWRRMYRGENLRHANGGHLREKFLQIGGELARSLFGENVPTFKKNQALCFVAEASLQNLPFELLPQGKDFLAETNLILRSLKIAPGQVAQKIHRRGKTLLLINSRDHAGLRNGVEAEAAEDFVAIARRGVETYRAENIRLEDVLARLKQSRNFHYAGHGTPSALPLWKNEKLTAAALAGLDLSHLHVAFVNSCDSASRDVKQKSLAEGFVLGGASHFIGYSVPVTNALAAFVSAQFWRYERHATPAQALFRARLAAREKFGDDDFGWLGVQYYTSEILSAKPATRPLLWRAVAGVVAIFVIVAATHSFFFGGRKSNIQIKKRELARTHKDSATRQLIAKNKPIKTPSENAGATSAETPSESLPEKPTSIIKPGPTKKSNISATWSAAQENKMHRLAQMVRAERYIPPQKTNCYLETQGFTLLWNDFIDKRKFTKEHAEEFEPVVVSADLADGNGSQTARIGGGKDPHNLKRTATKLNLQWTRLSEHGCLASLNE